MTITTRAGKGSPLTNAELDGNFTDLDGRATANAASVTALSVSTAAALADKVDADEIGQPGGVAELDSDGLVPADQLPADSVLVLNIAARGEAPTGKWDVSAPNTRIKCSRIFRVHTYAKRIRFPFANKFLTTSGESNGPGNITIRKLAVELAGVYKTCQFSGVRTLLMAPGAVDQLCDWIDLEVFPGNEVKSRLEADIVSGYPTDFRINGDQQWLYDPANEVDDVDGVGPMTSPSGAVFAFPLHPLMLIGEVAPGVEAVIGIGDSVAFGLADLGGDPGLTNQLGNGGGGFMRRAAWQLGVPYFSFTQSGRTLDASVTSHALQDSVVKYHNIIWPQLGINDLGSTSAATMKTRYISHWGHLRAAAPHRVHIQQMLYIPRVTTTDGCTTVENQTPISGWEKNGKADILNSWFGERLSVDIDSICDLRSVVADPTTPTKFAALSYSTTLAASAANNASSLSLNDVPIVGESLQFDPGGANNSSGFACVLSVTGAAAPFTVAISFSPGVNQSNGATVKATLSNDGTHPGGRGNIRMKDQLMKDFPRGV